MASGHGAGHVQQWVPSSPPARSCPSTSSLRATNPNWKTSPSDSHLLLLFPSSRVRKILVRGDSIHECVIRSSRRRSALPGESCCRGSRRSPLPRLSCAPQLARWRSAPESSDAPGSRISEDAFSWGHWACSAQISNLRLHRPRKDSRPGELLDVLLSRPSFGTAGPSSPSRSVRVRPRGSPSRRQRIALLRPISGTAAELRSKSASGKCAGITIPVLSTSSSGPPAAASSGMPLPCAARRLSSTRKAARHSGAERWGAGAPLLLRELTLCIPRTRIAQR